MPIAFMSVARSGANSLPRITNAAPRHLTVLLRPLLRCQGTDAHTARNLASPESRTTLAVPALTEWQTPAPLIKL